MKKVGYVTERCNILNNMSCMNIIENNGLLKKQICKSDKEFVQQKNAEGSSCLFFVLDKYV
jgi:hypothetical protein